MSIPKVYSHPVFQNLFTNCILIGVGFLTSIFIARKLGPEGNGIYRTALLWSMTIVAFGGMGIEKAVSFYTGKDSENAGNYYSTALCMLTVWAIPIYLLSLFFIPVALSNQPESTVRLVKIGLILIFIQFIGNLPFWILQGMGKFKKWNIIRSAYNVSWLVIVLFGTFLRSVDVKYYLYTYLILMFLFDIWWTISLFKSIKFTFKFQKKYILPLLMFGLPSLLTQIPQQLSVRFDQLLMSSVTTSAILGTYAVAVTWGDVITPLINSIAQYIFPRILKQSDSKVQFETTAKFLSFTITVSFALFLAVAIITPYLLPIVYGVTFKQAVIPAIIILFANVFRQFSTVASESIRGMGKPKVPMIAEIFGLVVTLIILIPTISKAPLIGASIASVCGYATVAAVFLFYLARASKVKVDKFIFDIEILKQLQELFLKRSKQDEKIYNTL